MRSIDKRFKEEIEKALHLKSIDQYLIKVKSEPAQINPDILELIKNEQDHQNRN